ncbi:hypothetical protein Sru01_04090 [Sphaerisporangium rufum]|uniref:FtsX extracellular domain-containing protein n=1 Tax=Sphaerisporangium rufum TaxID=1381558 RepID=A0A919R1W4_9ACTN|nr:permease-like cell division protein FtsX [Sphaerisporangium rufum]GII75427.1 hypothetical protein Sru01_04090 [Sphaerisporangium rufum]
MEMIGEDTPAGGRNREPHGSGGREELSFGGPDRESRLAGWAARHRRALAAAAGALAVLAALAAGGRHLYLESREPLPPPDAPLPAQVGFQVYLCPRPAASGCSAEDLRQARRPERIQAELRALPGVVSITYTSPEEAYRIWRRSSSEADAQGEGRLVVPAFLGASVTGTLRRPEDYAEVATRARRISGVFDVDRSPVSFWTGRADLRIDLCNINPVPRCGNVGTVPRPPSAAERQAIVDRIWRVDGVEKIYFEDRAHALRLARHYYPERALAGDAMLTAWNDREAFYVKTRDAAAARRVMDQVAGLPGVEAGHLLDPPRGPVGGRVPVAPEVVLNPADGRAMYPRRT